MSALDAHFTSRRVACNVSSRSCFPACATVVPACRPEGWPTYNKEKQC